MKRLILNVLLASGMIAGSFGQDLDRQIPSRRPVPPVSDVVAKSNPAPNELPTFDLDFPGGAPQKLVDAIQKEIRILNAVIPTEHKDLPLPALKMRSVNVRQLFEALELASQKTVTWESENPPGHRVRQERNTIFGFRSIGPITPETVWYFQAVKPYLPPDPPKAVRFYQLAPYLTEYKIDDLTTAIQAGWKMLGETETPQLNFHEDTKLLIAVGSVGKLQLIDMALAELGKGLKSPPARNPGYGVPNTLPPPLQ